MIFTMLTASDNTVELVLGRGMYCLISAKISCNGTLQRDY